ncbi:hypothetical protein I302_105901 [Kwoniella bestiolae CBS 10118]|uniref:Uncharacterized protein n=1 Tax=Kwoniella bestiolae CBS 10118 TaxID=1296100 RepID=A0A1B9G2G7_9TREE|nr:hypothetical protein I302_05026 [Kwoniella bestiolae CBS 10118]OCF25213.1 hypothetical protein I302_05026 [Kwoniella bestiolae CBS 10118]
MLGLHPRQLLRRPTSFPHKQTHIVRIRNRLQSTTTKPTPFVPFSEFKPPPIRQRLKPLIPFFIYWSIITSLAVHLLRIRISSKEELDKQKAKITVLSDLVERLRNGQVVGEEEVQRELEMVGLRERRVLVGEEERLEDTKNVGWSEVLFGKKRKISSDGEEDVQSLEELVQAVNDHDAQPTKSRFILLPTTPNIDSPERSGQAKRAPSSSVYM